VPATGSIHSPAMTAERPSLAILRASVGGSASEDRTGNVDRVRLAERRIRPHQHALPLY
jgi:hypothetical protein